MFFLPPSKFNFTNTLSKTCDVQGTPGDLKTGKTYFNKFVVPQRDTNTKKHNVRENEILSVKVTKCGDEEGRVNDRIEETSPHLFLPLGSMKMTAFE